MKKPTSKQAPSASSLPKMRTIKLENLEPRVLLAGDVLVQNPLEPQSSGVLVSAQDNSTASSSAQDSSLIDDLLSSENVHPLEVVSANGSVQEAALVERVNGNLELAAGSTLVGRGDLGGGLLNQGVVSPGASPGLLSVTSFEQAAAATLHMEIAGVQAGVIDVASDVVETPDDVVKTIEAVMKFVPKENIMATTNCGMAPMRRDIAEAKLQALGAGAKLAREKLG